MAEINEPRATDSASGSEPPAGPAPAKPRPWKRNSVFALLLLAGLTGVFLLAQGLRSSGEEKSRAARVVYALLQFSHHQPMVLHDSRAEERAVGEDFGTYMRTQEVLLKSRLVLVKALKKPEIAKLQMVQDQTDPVGWLEVNLHVQHTLSPEILRVELGGVNLAESAAVVNAVIGAYLNEMNELPRNELRNRLHNIRHIVNQAEDELRQKQDEYTKLSRALGVPYSLQETRLQQQFSDLQREATRLQIARIAAMAKYKYLAEKIKPGQKEDPQATTLMAELQKEIAILDKQRDELRTPMEEVRRPLEHNGLLDVKKPEIDVMQSVLRKLRTEQETLWVEIQSQAQRVFVLQEAEAPSK
jgi:hypothetical protein